MYSMKLDGTQKTSIILVTLFMVFLYILITLPSNNVGVYEHSYLHDWAITDSNGVALKDVKGYVIKEQKPYHCVLMERAFGEDNHINSYAKDDFESSHALYLELRQLEIDNPLTNSSTPNFALFLLIMGGFIVGIASVFGLHEISPDTFNKLIKKLKR